MTIDIKPGKGKWWVIAHSASGRAHDSFDTQAEALEFALDIYGGTVIEAEVTLLADMPTEGGDSLNLLLEEIAELDKECGDFLFGEEAA
ncbi:MAG: DUF2188 domain-containing protein [Candidatus Sericytochromatia bacterium]|nr:DUF2188 domain-containing protein [Candidatus Sericytochromatia bacterium]